MLALAWHGGVVFAHANLDSADPAPDSVLEEAPTRVVISFTEPLEPSFSEIRVLDSSGARVDNGDSTVDANNPVVMSVSLPPLEDGTYTVGWKNVSTVDGHRVRGSFTFSVGAPSEEMAVVDGHEALFHSPVEPFVGWALFLGVLLLVGAFSFELLVAGPVLGSRPSGDRLRRLWALHSTRLRAAALGLLVLASGAQLALQASAIHEDTILSAFPGPMVTVLAETDWGRLWIWRAGLAAAIAGLMVAQARWPGREPGLAVLSLCLGVGLLATLSLTSHAAATAGIRAWALANDLLHMVAASVWVGGLAALLLLAAIALTTLAGPQSRRVLAAAVPRFSVLAGLSVATLVVTGIYSAWAQVTIVEALASPYGAALMAKIALVLGLLLLGAVNLLWIRPRLALNDSAARWLRRLVAAEVVIAVLVVLVVGFLTALEPARQVASREGLGVPDSIEFTASAEGADVALRIEPGTVGLNRFEVSLADRLGEPIDNASDVSVRISYLDDDLGENILQAAPVGGGVYVAEEGRFSIAGAWQAELVVRRPDAFDARTGFRFEVEAGGSSAIAPSPGTGQVLLGVGLVLLGVLFLATGMPLGGLFTLRGAGVMTPGVLGLVAGAAMLFGSDLAGTSGTASRNPFPPDAESLRIGAKVYEDTCQACHGETGLGDGPAGVDLDPPPGNLLVHVPLHSDSELFGFVDEGIPGTAMAALGERLSDDEIWHVVNYIRTFEEQP
jgi:copper transport protein